MKYLPQNTLAYFAAAPQFQTIDLSEIPVAAFGKATQAYEANCGLVLPNDEAIKFYALNHCASVIRQGFTPNEPLPEWAREIMHAYMKEMSDQGKRMLHYILLITTREMRHLPATKSTFWAEMETKFGKEAKDFINKLPNFGDSIESAGKQYMEKAPSISVGTYAKALSYGFHKPSWPSSFGGKKWGIVTDAAVSMLHGKTSMETLVDVGFNLAHNGGPIFNKGMMYQTYQQPAFYTILDVQRSGQIPDLLLDTENYKVSKPQVAVDAVKALQAVKPHLFKGWVDWHEVKKAGAVANYHPYQQKQDIKHPKPVEPPKPKHEVFNGQKVVIKGDWTVFPGQTVQIFERVQ